MPTFNVIEREVWPDDPVTPGESFIASHRSVPTRFVRRAIRVWDDLGLLVGSVDLSHDPELDHDPSTFRCPLRVHPERRRRGVASAMLAVVAAEARSAGRLRLVGRTYSSAPTGEAFARAIGATPELASHTNRLLTAAVDRDQLRLWIADAARQAPEYELLAWDSRVPDEHLARSVARESALPPTRPPAVP